MASVPIIKLAGLLLRQVSKPMAKALQRRAVEDSGLRRLTISLGQQSHYLTTYLNIVASGHRARKIRSLEEEKALALGAEILGEAFVFGVAGLVLLFETERNYRQGRVKEESARKDKMQEERRQAERFSRLEEQQRILMDELRTLQAELRRRRRSFWSFW